jgi:hypothetical protein
MIEGKKLNVKIRLKSSSSDAVVMGLSSMYVYDS